MSLELTGNGRCIGIDAALEMFEVFVPDAISNSDTEIDAEEYEYALNRFRWLAQRVVPVKPKFMKGKYGHKYDSYSCGACGHVLHKGIYKYCPNCGREIQWEGY